MKSPVLRAVFFDVGGTLLRPQPSVGAIYARVGARHGFNASPDDMEHAFRAAWKHIKSSTVGSFTTSDKKWWRVLVFHALGTLGLSGTEQRRQAYFEELYDAFARPDAWQLDADAEELIGEIHRRGLHVGLISNWDARLRPLLKAMGLNASFDSMTISCEVMAEKPAAEIFLAALRAASVNAQEALHVGDNFEEDVRGAQAVGMRAIFLGEEAGAHPGCECVKRLGEIAAHMQ